ncbi:hydroxyproline O-arabinosyltransferase 3-like [Olea europaea var. sylvestris]|uniref:hydroxyproline O-arabinosyltransferase 3-like n=1 Tax=Olea europaea var. sylvestris TaxID=158386 RepID=UPI000C1D5819|nr:hydroxyproline O-arabinosyltransferase 3-like [Olea europaea var. sylvestris]
MGFLEKIAPIWMNVSLKMKNDPKTEYFWMDARNVRRSESVLFLMCQNLHQQVKSFSNLLFLLTKQWYAYAAASTFHGVQHILFKDFMLQPLSNVETRKKFILHFTYGSDYNMKVKSKGIT